MGSLVLYQVSHSGARGEEDSSSSRVQLSFAYRRASLASRAGASTRRKSRSFFIKKRPPRDRLPGHAGPARTR